MATEPTAVTFRARSAPPSRAPGAGRDVDANLIDLQRGIDRARIDLEIALEELEVAARRLASPAHWRASFGRVVSRRPAAVLAGAAAFGLWLGWRPRRRRVPRVSAWW